MNNKSIFVSLLTAVIAVFTTFSFALISENEGLKLENEQLQQEKEELRLDYVDMQIQRDILLDGAWHKNNQQMKEAE